MHYALKCKNFLFEAIRKEVVERFQQAETLCHQFRPVGIVGEESLVEGSPAAIFLQAEQVGVRVVLRPTFRHVFRLSPIQSG